MSGFTLGGRQEVDRRTAEALRSALAAAQRELEQAAELAGTESGSNDPPLNIARRLYQARRKRDLGFSAKLFGEPAWDALLALYIAGEEGRPMNVSSTWAAAGVGAATGGRMIQALERDGLIVRKTAPRRNEQFLELTHEAKTKLISSLEAFG